MPDINREASEFWNALKPMIDEEIKTQTRGMVQRRKMKVTTAPSLNTNKIGVTEPFGSEMFIPFTTNLISASVGDVVWVEFMYGMTNAFASMFASADEKDWDVAGNLSVVGDVGIGGNLGVSGSASLQNTTVNGVLDITPRRCYASLSSAGWYRVMKIVGGAGGWSFSVDFDIARAYNNTNNEVHCVKMLKTYNTAPSFVNEESKTNTINVSAIRYTVDSNGVGYVDIRYDANSNNTVSVDFTVHTAQNQQSYFTAESLQSVADSPSGETVLTEYSFAANTTVPSNGYVPTISFLDGTSISVSTVNARYEMNGRLLLLSGRFTIGSMSASSNTFLCLSFPPGITIPANEPANVGFCTNSAKTWGIRCKGSLFYLSDGGGNYSKPQLTTGSYQFNITAFV